MLQINFTDQCLIPMPLIIISRFLSYFESCVIRFINFWTCKFDIMNAKYLIAGLIICTILFGSLADAQLLRRSGAISGTEVKDSQVSSAQTSEKVPFNCLPGEKKVCTLGPPPVCHCEPLQVVSLSNGQSTSSGPILSSKLIGEIKPVREQGIAGQTGVTLGRKRKKTVLAGAAGLSRWATEPSMMRI